MFKNRGRDTKGGCLVILGLFPSCLGYEEVPGLGCAIITPTPTLFCLIKQTLSYGLDWTPNRNGSFKSN